MLYSEKGGFYYNDVPYCSKRVSTPALTSGYYCTHPDGPYCCNASPECSLADGPRRGADGMYPEGFSPPVESNEYDKSWQEATNKRYGLNKSLLDTKDK